MDFIEFLKDGSVGAYWRVTFDGKNFKKENDTFPEFVMGNCGYVYEKINYGLSTDYIMESSDAGYNWLSWIIKSKSDYTKRYRIEVNVHDHYVTLKEYYGDTIHSYDDLKDSEDADEKNTSKSSSSSDSDSDGGIINGIFSLIFPPFILIRALYIEYKYDDYKVSNIVANIFCCIIGILIQCWFITSLVAREFVSKWAYDHLIVYISYIVFYSISIIVLPFAGKIAKLIKSDIQLVIPSIIYSLILVAIWVLMLIINYD